MSKQQSEQEVRIYALIKHQLREARSTDKSVTELFKPIKNELEKYVEAQLEEGKEETNRNIAIENKSFCGCPMCEFHATAYEIYNSTTP